MLEDLFMDYLKNYPLGKCGEIGSMCAGHIITQLGSRSSFDLKQIIQKNYLDKDFFNH